MFFPHECVKPGVSARGSAVACNPWEHQWNQWGESYTRHTTALWSQSRTFPQCTALFTQVIHSLLQHVVSASKREAECLFVELWFLKPSSRVKDFDLHGWRHFINDTTVRWNTECEVFPIAVVLQVLIFVCMYGNLNGDVRNGWCFFSWKMKENLKSWTWFQSFNEAKKPVVSSAG